MQFRHKYAVYRDLYDDSDIITWVAFDNSSKIVIVCIIDISLLSVYSVRRLTQIELAVMETILWNTKIVVASVRNIS